MHTAALTHIQVWLAKPLDTDGSLPRTDKRDGKEPKLLTDACDPVVSPDAREFLRWLKPVDCSESGAVEGGIILHAGDALYIPPGMFLIEQGNNNGDVLGFKQSFLLKDARAKPLYEWMKDKGGKEDSDVANHMLGVFAAPVNLER